MLRAEIQMPKFSNFVLLKHQELAVRRYINKPYFGLLWDCGTGKTLGAFSIAKMKSLPTIIIAPKSLTKQWREKLIEEFGVSEKDVFVYDSSKMKTKKKQKEYKEFMGC